MSFWVYLNHVSGEPLKVERHCEGGTVVVGGSEDAALNVTYNYSPFFYTALDKESGLRWLNGRKAADTIKALESAVANLGVKQDADYWAATAGNAGYALSILLRWARQNPNGTWLVS